MARPARNAEYTKEYNRKLFMRLLRTEDISRSEIARRMGLTRAATSLIADELIGAGYVTEVIPGGRPLGRNPVPLRLVPEAAYAVGICLRRDGCYAGIVDLRGNVLAQSPLLSVSPREITVLTDGVRDLLQQTGIPMDKVVGLGVSAPGPLDGENGLLLNPPAFELWHFCDIVTLLRRELDMPVYLANDAACMAQFNVGKPAAQGSENFLLLQVDNGIGSGVIIRGKALKGAGYFTGDLGHTTVDLNGRKCVCGNRGCLEAYASIPNLLKNSGYTTWAQLVDNRFQDPRAARLIQQEMDYLTAGIVNMANLVSLDTVLLAGDLLYRPEVVAPVLEEQVNARILHRDILPVKVLPSQCGPDVPLQAAADLAFDWFLRV